MRSVGSVNILRQDLKPLVTEDGGRRWRHRYAVSGLLDAAEVWLLHRSGVMPSIVNIFLRKGIMRNAHAVFRFALASLLVLLSVDAILYMGRFIKVNCSGWSEDIKASQLPKEVVSCVELYDDPPESVGVYVLHRDIDGDGIEELIVDSGTNGRGAANWHYTIWKRQLSGIYRNIGFFCADGYLFVPGWRIRGLPGILCNHGKVEWVPWRDGQYSCRGPI